MWGWCCGLCRMAVLRIERFALLGILQWLREQGCPWNTLTCLAAARGGDLATLQWAREHGCDWHERTCAVAAKRGHLELLQWAAASGNAGAAAAVHAPAAAAGHAGDGGGLYESGDGILVLGLVYWEDRLQDVKLKQSYKMSKVRCAFCLKKGIREDEVRFVFLGVPVEGCLTCDEHGMVHGDQVNVIREVVG